MNVFKDSDRSTKLYDTLKKYLTKNDLYNSVDEIMIEECVFMILCISDAKKEISTKGVNITVTSGVNGKSRVIQNPAIGTYLSMTKSLGSYMQKLNIPPEMRKKIHSHAVEDTFDEIFN
jgi:hypothetical protein